MVYVRGYPDGLFLSLFSLLPQYYLNRFGGFSMCQCKGPSLLLAPPIFWMKICSLNSDKGIQGSPPLNCLQSLWARGATPILFHRGPIIRKHLLFFTEQEPSGFLFSSDFNVSLNSICASEPKHGFGLYHHLGLKKPWAPLWSKLHDTPKANLIHP